MRYSFAFTLVTLSDYLIACASMWSAYMQSGAHVRYLILCVHASFISGA
jgi:hypothetical protein